MFVYPQSFDVIVVGAGHAGVEAGLAAARMGLDTLMLAINIDTVGQMSCNPAIGGLAKGHLVREIDALGGEMGINTDLCGLQFRMLNTRKGPSVWAPRAQCDKKAYQFRLKWVCERQANLTMIQGQAAKILFRDGEVYGVETNMEVQYHGKAVVVTTGTFLRGLMHVGSAQAKGGRAGEAASMGLSDSLVELGLQLGRLKTGTPPRLLRKSIDFAATEEQFGDEPVPYFSYWKDELFHVEHKAETGTGDFESKDLRCRNSYPPGSILEGTGGQIPCYITTTSVATKKLIEANLHRSPMYSGEIEGTGPRYCPSIEDKIVRFSDKETHQVFLEPEGIRTDEFYVNGFSTCLPYELQIELVRTIAGCERADILRPAYAVEYDFVLPTQLNLSLETKVCRNLFLAGQINGTSGYEEAGAQGLIAGVNAARRVLEKPPLVLKRNEAYIGVMIDDLVMKGTIEPYRMFTSRAEYRLLLRQDNADLRLCDIAYEMGLLSEARYERFSEKRRLINDEIEWLRGAWDGSDNLAQLLKRPNLHYADLPNCRSGLPSGVIKQVEIALKYEGYIARQEAEVQKFKNLEDKQIPDWVDYTSIKSMRNEAKQRLQEVRPQTVGQAARISGISPSDIGLLMVHMKRGAGNMQVNETGVVS
ncbi:MAG: tRNA uridine 5-carboxymethylaminomethyl modification enzyme MnmG [Verrucomicrobia subdivision 3 bacterium]|nr:tRNA uridine 5-carboxymethylaminomethyl modification enzyme MnmG [Limisphaerales bacterium]MCS1414689.1 tRNA uridine 5-carboxymethylaminomethyl modification enzyme MnmG [Limisphaerales bacterium]